MSSARLSPAEVPPKQRHYQCLSALIYIAILNEADKPHHMASPANRTPPAPISRAMLATSPAGRRRKQEIKKRDFKCVCVALKMILARIAAFGYKIISVSSIILP